MSPSPPLISATFPACRRSCDMMLNGRSKGYCLTIRCDRRVLRLVEDGREQSARQSQSSADDHEARQALVQNCPADDHAEKGYQVIHHGSLRCVYAPEDS